MSNYYQELRKAYFYINDQLELNRTNNSDMDINKLLLIITTKYPVSEKAILKRLERIRKIRGDFDIDEEVLIWKKEESKEVRSHGKAKKDSGSG